jgi:hypothetical protein
MSFPMVGREIATEVELEICEGKGQEGDRGSDIEHTLTTIAAVQVMTMKTDRRRLRCTTWRLAFSRLRSWLGEIFR